MNLVRESKLHILVTMVTLAVTSVHFLFLAISISDGI